ncbi:MAG: hypothetical protein FWF09_02345 [Bacteroidales bacterium]|nr:hypothetical protein [Bacteroidales bacterium]
MIWQNLYQRFRHIYAFFDRYGEMLFYISDIGKSHFAIWCWHFQLYDIFVQLTSFRL